MRGNRALRRQRVLVLVTVVATFAAASARADAPVPVEYRQAIQRMFDAGLVLGRDRLDAASAELEQLRGLAPGDPRVEYAWGLVLVKQMRWGEATTQFQKAAHPGDDGTYLPAWRAHTWVLVVRGKRDPAVTEIANIVGYLVDGDADELSPEALETARWLGQIVKAMELSATTQPQRVQAVQLRERVPAVFDQRLQDAFAAGLGDIEAQHLRLARDAGGRREERAEGQRDRAQARAEKLDEKLTDVERRKEDADKLAVDARQKLEETLAAADKQLALLEKDYRFLEGQALQVNRAKESVLAQRSLLELAMSRRREPAPQQLAQLSYLNQTLLRYAEEYLRLRQKQQAVLQTAGRILQQRAAAVQRLGQISGQAVKQSASLDAWAERLARQKETAEATAEGRDDNAGAQAAAAEPPRAVRGSTPALRSLMDLDLAAERDRIFRSLGILEQKPNEEADR